MNGTCPVLNRRSSDWYDDDSKFIITAITGIKIISEAIY